VAGDILAWWSLGFAPAVRGGVRGGGGGGGILTPNP